MPSPKISQKITTEIWIKPMAQVSGRAYTLDEIERLRKQIRDKWIEDHLDEDGSGCWSTSEEKEYTERTLRTALIGNVEPPNARE